MFRLEIFRFGIRLLLKCEFNDMSAEGLIIPCVHPVLGLPELVPDAVLRQQRKEALTQILKKNARPSFETSVLTAAGIAQELDSRIAAIEPK